MSLANRLSLDHFYLLLPENKFYSMKDQLVKLGASHQIVQSGEDSWEGLYLHSRTGEYFEILKNENAGFGMAFSATVFYLTETKTVIESLKNYNWKSGTRLTKNNEKWFDWYSTGEYSDLKTLLNVWVMAYHKRHIDYAEMPFVKSILSFDKIYMSVGKENLDAIEKVLELPLFHSVEKNDSFLSFKCLRRDGWFFKIIIQLVEGNQRFAYHELLYTLSDPNTGNVEKSKMLF